MKEYDLILVVGYFRTAASFLSVARALGRSLRLAVVPADADPAMKSKTGEAHETFIDLCRGWGADILAPGEPARCALMVVQQFPYGNELAATLRRSIDARRQVALMTLAMAGLDKHDAFLAQFDIRKAYVPSRRFMQFLLERRGAQARWRGVEVEEVGLPFARHRVFPDFGADWLIAAPTLFSFHSEAGKQQFLQTVLQLLEQLPPQDVVVYKSHNGNSLDYFAPRVHHRLAGLVGRIPGGGHLLQGLRRLPSAWLRRQADRVRTCLLHRAVLRRAVPMADLTPHAGMSLEAFLPGVRKGVIGGLSNTIWGAAYFDLPYYNCVDPSLRQGASELLNKRSDALLDLNLQYFGVPFCDGDLRMDTRQLQIVRPDERRGDLVAALLGDLELAREAATAQA